MDTQKTKRKIRVAIVGTRGIPAKHGGYETITQDLGIGLVEKGFEVYVACQSNGFKRNPYALFRNVRLVYFPIINAVRNLSDVMLYDALSVVWATFNVDIIYMLSYTNSPLLIFPRLFGKIILVNADGLEWKRRKYSRLSRFLLRSFESLSLKIVDCMIVDSQVLGLYYQENYRINPSYIPYGIKEIQPLDETVLENYKLTPNQYYLVIARLEPENNIDLIINEFEKSKSNKKLVIVAPLLNTAYVKKLLESKSDNVFFLGGIYQQRLQRTLRHNCFAYIHGHEVGGTNPTLVEALSCSSVILALDVPFNMEVAGESAFYFTKDPGDLSAKIRLLEHQKPDQLLEAGKKGYQRYLSKYRIDGMVNASEALFKKIFDGKLNSGSK